MVTDLGDGPTLEAKGASFEVIGLTLMRTVVEVVAKHEIAPNLVSAAFDGVFLRFSSCAASTNNICRCK